MGKYNSTIIPKKKQLKCGCFDYAFSKGRCKTHSVIEDTLKRMNEADEKDDEFSDLIKECDALFSRYIRLKYVDEDGLVNCFTCSERLLPSNIQNGHYISRYSMLLRFDERNCRPQCKTCNEYKRGNLAVYGQRLELEYKGITEILLEESHIVYKYNIGELRQMIIDFKSKINSLPNHKSIKK